MTMDFDHAVKVVKNYGNGDLLKGLEEMKAEMAETYDDGTPLWLTGAQVTAYRIVCREMRKLFF